MLQCFPGNREWTIQVQRLVAQAPYGGSDLNECLTAVRGIRPGDGESWVGAWRGLGGRIERAAQTALDAGHTVTARDAFFRASAYFRQADFFLAPTDERKTTLFLDARRCFLAAARLHRPAIEPIEVAYGEETYAGYFCHPLHPRGPRAAGVIMLGGADSLAEELFFFGGNQVTARGMALLLIDTPGRGSSLRLKGIRTRPDYEKPVGAVIDYLQARPEVDPHRIGLAGVSMGGYYAPRVAACDVRIRAMVLNCGAFDLVEDLFDFFPPIQPQMRWLVGAESIAEAREAFRPFTLEGVAGRIRCPALVEHGADDFIMRVEGARRLYGALGSRDKTLKIWGGEEGGAVHCGFDNWAALFPHMFDWLADRLG
ncbi:MAG TPA: alpha/beta fold hydrolase [Candidatus Methylomirabilis sp.]|jgi:dienelactone hydrolase